MNEDSMNRHTRSIARFSVNESPISEHEGVTMNNPANNSEQCEIISTENTFHRNSGSPQKICSDFQKTKHWIKLKELLFLLDSALPVSCRTRSQKKILQDTVNITSQLEDCLSNILAKKRMDNGNAIYNSAPFTLSHTRASYVRFLKDAETNIKFPSDLEKYLKSNVTTAASEFFNNLVHSCMHTQHSTRSPVTSASTSSSIFVTNNKDIQVPTTPVAHEKIKVEWEELENGLGYSSVTTSQPRGLNTPRQNEEDIQSSHSTQVPGVKPRKQRCVTTPSTTPASLAKRDNCSTPPHNPKKLCSSVRKKRLTFAGMSPSSSKENINTDYLYNEKVKGKRFASDSSSHEFLPKRSRYRSGSFSSGSEPDTQDSDRSRKAYHSRCSEPMYKLPCFKRSLCSSHFTAPVSPLKQKNGPINGTYLPSSTSQSEYFDSGTLCLKLKDNEMNVSQKSFGDLDKDSSSELLHANPDCIKIAYCKNSNADESRKNLIDETPLSSGESVTCKSNTVRNFEKYQCFTIEQEGCFNFLSDNCEKKESPVKFGAEISTSPRHLYRHPLLNSPSYFLVTDALVTASASSQSSSPVYHNTKIDCKTFEDLKELNMQDKVPSHSNSKFLPLTLDISSPLKEDVACGNSKIFDELQCVPQGEKTLLVSSHTNISMQESDTPTKGLHIPILSTTSEQSPAVSRVWSLAPGLQDLESKTPSCTLIPTKRLSSSSPSQPSLPELLKPGSSKQDFVTSIQKSYKMRDMVPSKTGALGFDGLKSFITPEGRSYVYPLGAPRKISKPTSRQQPPRCKRSLVRQFASDVTTVFNTPPDSPARLVGDLLPEMESDSEI